jgi:hypothetical protein
MIIEARAVSQLPVTSRQLLATSVGHVHFCPEPSFWKKLAKNAVVKKNTAFFVLKS